MDGSSSMSPDGKSIMVWYRDKQIRLFNNQQRDGD